jgi:hypothetical protein
MYQYISIKSKNEKIFFLIFDFKLVSEPTWKVFFFFFFWSNATMSKSNSKASSNKLGHIIIQSEGSSLNVRILLNKTNYDMWSQIIEMHITKKEKVFFICGN